MTDKQKIEAEKVTKLIDFIDSLAKLDVSAWDVICGACADLGIPLSIIKGEIA